MHQQHEQELEIIPQHGAHHRQGQPIFCRNPLLGMPPCGRLLMNGWHMLELYSSRLQA